MKGRKWLTLLLLLFLVMVLASGCSKNQEGAPQQGNNQEEPNEEPILTGKELVDTRCVGCHNLDDRVYGRKRNQDSWPGIVDRMVKKSPGLLNDQETQQVVEFLQENYSK